MSNLYRGEWVIEPAHMGYTWSHKDYQGPGDRRIGNCRTAAECRDAVDRWLLEVHLQNVEAENGKLEDELSAACKVLLGLYDKFVTQGSYGVPGSEFSTCDLCGAGGSPSAKFEHSQDCPLLEVEQYLFSDRDTNCRQLSRLWRLTSLLRFKGTVNGNRDR